MFWVGRIFFPCFSFFDFFYFERTRPAASMRPPCLIYLSTSTGVRTGCHYLISLYVCPSVYLPVCNIRRFYCIRELYEADLHKIGIYGSGRVWANAWDVFRRTSSRVGRGRRAAVEFVVCLGCGGISCFLFRFLFFERTRPAASMRPPCLIYLSTSSRVGFN